jgi:hypothetical protein
MSETGDHALRLWHSNYSLDPDSDVGESLGRSTCLPKIEIFLTITFFSLSRFDRVRLGDSSARIGEALGTVR